MRKYTILGLLLCLILGGGLFVFLNTNEAARRVVFTPPTPTPNSTEVLQPNEYVRIRGDMVCLLDYSTGHEVFETTTRIPFSDSDGGDRGATRSVVHHLLWRMPSEKGAGWRAADVMDLPNPRDFVSWRECNSP